MPPAKSNVIELINETHTLERSAVGGECYLLTKTRPQEASSGYATRPTRVHTGCLPQQRPVREAFASTVPTYGLTFKFSLIRGGKEA